MIRPAIPADIPTLLDLERACASAAHWTEQQYQQILHPGKGDPQRLLLVAERPPKCFSTSVEPKSHGSSSIVGFLVARHLAPEWELENIVVLASARRKGFGTQLLKSLVTKAREAHGEAVFLEVRESNLAARSMYENAGFELTGRRRNYYANPLDDAILYRLRLNKISFDRASGTK